MSTTNSWQQGNNEDDISYASGGQISYPAQSGGSLNSASDSWNSANSLPSGDTINWANSVVYGGYIYVLGGFDNGTPLLNVYYAQINTGSLGTWKSTTSLPGVFVSLYAQATSVAYNGYVYAIGGSVSSGSGVYFAPFIKGGGLGTWVQTTSLPSYIYIATSVVYNGYIYEIGGMVYYNASQNTVYYAPINGDGTLGNWTSTSSLPADVDSATSVVYNGYIYEIGGANGWSPLTSTVYYAPINSNGTLGNWIPEANSLQLVTMNSTSVAYNGYIYEIGGCVNTSNTCVTSTVEYAPIYANGATGLWETTTSLPASLQASTSFVYNGYIYEIGGATNGNASLQSVTDTNLVYYAKIDRLVLPVHIRQPPAYLQLPIWLAQ